MLMIRRFILNFVMVHLCCQPSFGLVKLVVGAICLRVPEGNDTSETVSADPPLMNGGFVKHFIGGVVLDVLNGGNIEYYYYGVPSNPYSTILGGQVLTGHDCPP